MKDVRRISLRKVSFIAFVVISMFVIAFSLFEYIETYATISNLSLSFDDVTLLGVDFNFSSIVLNFTLTNPSRFLPIKLKSFSIQSYLNGEELQYLRRILYYERDIPPNDDFRIIVNFQKLEESDLRIIEYAREQNRWQWYFKIDVHVNVLFKEAFLDLSKTGSGINLPS